MVPVPSIVQDFFTDGDEDLLLIGVLGGVRNVEPVLIGSETIVGPEGIVEGEVTVPLRVIKIYGFTMDSPNRMVLFPCMSTHN
jgi:hypothetical protein